MISATDAAFASKNYKSASHQLRMIDQCIIDSINSGLTKTCYTESNLSDDVIDDVIRSIEGNGYMCTVHYRADPMENVWAWFNISWEHVVV